MIVHPAERSGERRGRFASLAELASDFTSSPLFSGICVLLVGIFVAARLADLPIAWQEFTGSSMTAVTLLLLALLKNAERRAERAIQIKLDAIAGALLSQHGGIPGEEARDALREAIRIEEEI